MDHMFLHKLFSNKLLFNKLPLNKLVISTALAVAPFSSYSQEISQDTPTDNTGWYVGGVVGQVSSEFANGPKEQDSTLGIYGGYNFSSWFGLEGALFGANQSLDTRGYFSPTFLVGFSVTPKFTLVVNDAVAIYLKAGVSILTYSTDYSYYQQDYVYSDSGARRNVDRDNGDSWGGVGETFGVGGEFRIAKGVRLRIGYDYTSADIENLDYDYYYDNFEVSLSQVSVGVHYQF
jgi:opacity protein-like surface antigen